MDGRTVGIVANQPAVPECSTSQSVGESRAFYPLQTASTSHCSRSSMFPALCPAKTKSNGGNHPSRCQAALRVHQRPFPRSRLITRKAYGGAYDVMASKHVRADKLGLPDGRDRGHGPEGGQHHLSREQLAQSSDPEGTRAAYVREYRDKFANPLPPRRSVTSTKSFARERRAQEDHRRAAHAQNKRQQTRPKHSNIPLPTCGPTEALRFRRKLFRFHPALL